MSTPLPKSTSAGHSRDKSVSDSTRMALRAGSRSTPLLVVSSRRFDQKWERQLQIPHGRGQGMQNLTAWYWKFQPFIEHPEAKLVYEILQ